MDKRKLYKSHIASCNTPLPAPSTQPHLCFKLSKCKLVTTQFAQVTSMHEPSSRSRTHEPTHARTHARKQARKQARMHAPHAPTHAITHSRTYSITHSFIHSLTHSLTQTHTHTHTHSDSLERQRPPQSHRPTRQRHPISTSTSTRPP